PRQIRDQQRIGRHPREHRRRGDVADGLVRLGRPLLDVAAHEDSPASAPVVAGSPPAAFAPRPSAASSASNRVPWVTASATPPLSSETRPGTRSGCTLSVPSAKPAPAATPTVVSGYSRPRASSAPAGVPSSCLAAATRA